MPDLTPVSALAGMNNSIGCVTLQEVTDRALVSIAFGPAERERVSDSLQQSTGTHLPAVGSCTSIDNSTTLLGLQLDQVWLSLSHDGSAMDKTAHDRLRLPDGVYLTDQSDGWTALVLSGDKVQSVLERLCPLDLDTQQFPVDAVARTSIDHSGVILVRKAVNAYELITPRSSVASFVHAVESVAEHILNEHALSAGKRPAPGNNTTV